jgi:hypothetical protein
MKADLFSKVKLTVVKRRATQPTPIPCKGYWTDTDAGREYDCDYEHAGLFGCEDCIVNNGPYDPRTGKRFAKRRKR